MVTGDTVNSTPRPRCGHETGHSYVPKRKREGKREQHGTFSGVSTGGIAQGIMYLSYDEHVACLCFYCCCCITRVCIMLVCRLNFCRITRVQQYALHFMSCHIMFLLHKHVFFCFQQTCEIVYVLGHHARFLPSLSSGAIVMYACTVYTRKYTKYMGLCVSLGTTLVYSSLDRGKVIKTTVLSMKNSKRLRLPPPDVSKVMHAAPLLAPILYLQYA